MSRRLGQATTQKDEGGISAGWLLAGGVAGIGIYFLTKELFKAKVTPPSSMTQVMPLPPSTPPSRYANFDSVNSRYSQIRDLYHMGPAHMSGPQAIAEINTLQTAAKGFADQGQVDRATANGLIADMENFKNQIIDAMQFIEAQKQQQPAMGIGGNPRRYYSTNGNGRRFA